MRALREPSTDVEYDGDRIQDPLRGNHDRRMKKPRFAALGLPKIEVDHATRGLHQSRTVEVNGSAVGHWQMAVREAFRRLVSSGIARDREPSRRLSR